MPTRIEPSGDTATLILDEPRGNALSKNTIATFMRALDELEASSARAVVVTGAGRVFGAGLDLVEAHALPRPALRDYVDAFEALFLRLFTFPLPLFAAVNGHALAGGAVIALACDVRIVIDGRVTVGLNEVELGMPFPSVALEVARFGLPPSRQIEALAFGQRYDADGAVAAGFAHEKHADPLARARARAQHIATLGPSAVRTVRATLKREHVERARENAEASREAFVDAWLSDEVQPRIRKLVEDLKRRA